MSDEVENKMEFHYFIDGRLTCERTFWNRLSILASPDQTRMIMDGYKVMVAESLYWLEAERG